MSRYSQGPNRRVDFQRNIQPDKRGLDVRQDQPEQKSIVIDLYKIDETILTHMKKIVPLLDQDGTSVEIPVIYPTPERWKAIQQDGVYRDKFDKMQLPIIALQRVSMEESEINSSVNKYQSYSFSSVYNKRNIYDKFSVLNGIKPSKEYYETIIPDYYDITYDCVIWTELMSQMNTVVGSIASEDEEFWGNENDYRFRTSLGQFVQDTSLSNDKNRIIRTKFSLKVHGYLLPERVLNRHNKKSPVTKIRYTPKKIVVFTEIVGTGQKYENMEDIPSDIG
jgi:hypothetical protein